MHNPVLLQTRERLQELYDQYQEDIPLLEGLALIAREEDQKESYEAIIGQFEALKKRFYLASTNDVYQGVARLNIHFFQTLGLQGDSEDYYSPFNSILHKVIERKKIWRRPMAATG